MNIVFMRHGEATDNVKKIISDKEIYWSTLTKSGVEAALESIEVLPPKIDKIYVSPFPRTLQTAHYVFEKYYKTEVVIDNRLREINNGKYTQMRNNEDLDGIRRKQINGDYFVRFGEYGENKYDIESRLCSFLKDVYDTNFKSNTIIIVSHGSVISYLKRILCITSPHVQTGKVEELIDVDFNNFFNYAKKLSKIRLNEIKKRVEIVKALEINNDLKNNLAKMVRKEFNNAKLAEEHFMNYIDGISTKNLKNLNNSNLHNGIILVCFYNNFENFVDKWMKHYIDIGINNFVLIDNNSTDNSTKKLKAYESAVNISFWEIHEEYNSYKMCGWKQQIFEFYGINQEYLTVDSDELFIYKDYKETKLINFVKNEKLTIIKTMLLDVYTTKNLLEGSLKDFKYVDKNTYKTSVDIPCGVRFFGGPISRVLDINTSLQKISFIKYTGKEIFVSDHFYYPWNLNNKAKFCAYLLHYNFFTKDDRDLSNYSEYKNISFYDENISILINDIDLSCIILYKTN
ncbi:MAG: histidine phosphatase family protein [Clostridia bacterium]